MGEGRGESGGREKKHTDAESAPADPVEKGRGRKVSYIYEEKLEGHDEPG